MTFMNPARTVATTSSTDLAPLMTAIEARYTAAPHTPHDYRQPKRTAPHAASTYPKSVSATPPNCSPRSAARARARSCAPRTPSGGARRARARAGRTRTRRRAPSSPRARRPWRARGSARRTRRPWARAARGGLRGARRGSLGRIGGLLGGCTVRYVDQGRLG